MATPHAETVPELANWLTLLSHQFEGHPLAQFLHHWENILFAVFLGSGLSLIAWLGSRRRALIPEGFQNLLETVVEGLDQFIAGILGERGRHYLPFLGTLFLYILCMNWAGLVPGFKSPTAGLAGGLNVTVSLALIVFLYVQTQAVKHMGWKGYLDHLLGQPRGIIGWVIAIMTLGPLTHVIGELVKPMSLSLRLFGNITGEDTTLAAFVNFGIWGLPFQLFAMGLGLILGAVQALVFTVLSAVYIGLVTEPHG